MPLAIFDPAAAASIPSRISVYTFLPFFLSTYHADEETGSKGRQRGERDLGREEKEKEREREIKGTQEEVREGVQL